MAADVPDNDEVDDKSKRGSLAFFLAIPVSFAGSAFALNTILNRQSLNPLWSEQILIFTFGALATCVIWLSASVRYLRTLIHELRHAILVVLTGGTIKRITVKAGSGSVHYNYRLDHSRFTPFIGLAPYFLPVCSLPALLLFACFTDEDRSLAALILGLLYGFDLFTAVREFGPHQTDLKKLRGGVATGFLFALSVNLFWSTLLALWVVAGNIGFAELTFDVVAAAFESWKQVEAGIKIKSIAK
jgi:hypothetical protein